MGHQDGASAPTQVVEEGDHRVGHQDGASAPTHHPSSPRPYVVWGGI